MSEHTPGLLTYEPAYKQGFVIWGGSNSIPVEIVSSCDDEGRWGAIKDVANARRLVAAWNACEGFETDLLENIVMTGGTLKSRFALRTQEERESKAERESLRAVNAELLDALEKLLKRDERNTCQHDETHRGGAIWEICDQCGDSWLDDISGKPKWKEPAEWSSARAAIASARKQGEQG